MSNFVLDKTCPTHWVILVNNQVLVKKTQSTLPFSTWQDLDFIHHHYDNVELISSHLDFPLCLVDLGREYLNVDDYETLSMREYLMQSGDIWYEQVARAWQVAHFLRTHKYCGQCGAQMQRVDWELAMQCDRCGHRCYPRISPCIIVAIRNGDQILLAQGKQQKQNNLYSVLAGFVESGETLEQAVHREVQEEVGIKIKNLRYFASQPWPFPHSLMMGYLADYDSGDIQIDHREILHAQWFDTRDLPNTPHSFSIAGRLISHICEQVENPSL